MAARGHDPRGLAKAVSGGAPGEDWILVIDDYHHALESEDAEAFLEELVSLTEFRLLITSRERPSWLKARRVVYGEAAVVEMEALAFTDEEALQVLGGHGAEIVAEARGWPAVIGLAAMRGDSDVASGLPPDELYRFFALLYVIGRSRRRADIALVAYGRNCRPRIPNERRISGSSSASTQFPAHKARRAESSQRGVFGRRGCELVNGEAPVGRVPLRS
jgi:hypothetical protein